MTLLITGICGFAGSVIARHLPEHSPGLSITGFDNLSRRGSETNVEPLKQLGIDVRIGDVRDRVFLDSLPAADWILDCAANPSVLAGVDGSGSRDLVDQNLYGTINLLELCKQWKAGFILLSTSRVYSIPPLADLPLRETPTRFEPDIQPATLNSQPATLSPSGLSESFSTAPPVSLYGSTKLCSELLALEYGSAFDFPVWINRCGVLAGAGQFGKADQGIFSYWIHSWRAGRPLKYIGFGGTGKQVRDCLHPRDLVPLLLKQMATRFEPDLEPQKDAKSTKIPDQASPFASSAPSCGNSPPLPHSPSETSDLSAFSFPLSTFPKIINVSGGITNSMSLLELSMWCQSRFGPHPTLEISAFHLPLSAFSSRPFDIPWMVLDPSLASETWSWSPATPLEEILEEIAQHAEANPNWLDVVT